MRSVMGASAALESLVELMPAEAHRVTRSGDTEDVSVSDLNPGDKVVVKPGGKVPIDGTINQGRTSLNESMLTGESTPVERGEGDAAIGGPVNGEAAFIMKVQKTGDETYLCQVIEMVRRAQESQSKTQNLADRAAKWLTITALSIGLGTLVAWLVPGAAFDFSIGHGDGGHLPPRPGSRRALGGGRIHGALSEKRVIDPKSQRL